LAHNYTEINSDEVRTGEEAVVTYVMVSRGHPPEEKKKLGGKKIGQL
jgi:hypothetical protein